MNTRTQLVAAIAAVAGGAASATAGVLFEAINDNGFFTPFDAGNADVVRYGDGGWLTPGGSPPQSLGAITLGLVVFGAAEGGTTDLHFTFNDGDPSGLVFGSGAELYSTTIRDVPLPATGPGEAEFFSLTIELPGVETLGNFNDVGFSIATENFEYDGAFGFQTSSTNGQIAGFYTNNASFFDGDAWSLFSFGPDPVTGVANFVALIESGAPCPADLEGTGVVDGADLGVLLASWGGRGPADLTGDGVVDGADLGILLAEWGPCPD